MTRLSNIARNSAGHPANRQRGFSMIEVLIALVVLAIGLLGLALLQTTNLRYTKSANQRTQAVNLAAELIDTVRANRSQAAAYAAGITPGAFDAALNTLAEAGCQASAPLTAAANIARWNCEVVEALGEGANAEVVLNGNEITVLVTWGDEFWAATPTFGSGRITLVSQI